MDNSSEYSSENSAFIEEITAKVTSNLTHKLKTTKSKLRSELFSFQESIKTEFEAIKNHLESLQISVNQLENERKKQFSNIGNHLNSMSEVNVKIDKFSEDIDFIRTSIIELGSELALKASGKDVSRVTEKMSTLCPLHYAQSLEVELRLKAPLSTLLDHEKRLEATICEFRGQYASREQTLQEFRKMDEKIESNLKMYVNSQYFTRVTMEMQKTSDFLRHKIEESTGDLRRRGVGMREEMDQLKVDVNGKASIGMYQELRRIVNTCASNTQVETLTTQILGFGKTLEGFRGHMTNCLEGQDKILERYDEVILEKASKVDVKELDMRIKAISRHIDFERRVDSMESHLTSCLAQNKQHTADLESLSTQVLSFAKTIQGVKSEKREIAMVKNTLQDLMEIVGTKADKTQIAELVDLKASVLEVERLSKTQEVMMRIDKVAIVLLQHTIKYLNSGNGKVTVEWLGRHADLVAGWIQVYDPSREEDLPLELGQLLQPQRLMTARVPTAPTMKTPAGLALLTPTKKSRPVTPSHPSSSKLGASLVSSRSVPRRNYLQQPPSLESSLLHP